MRVMMQRQVPMFAKVQETVEMSQVQYIDEAVYVPMAMQTPVLAIQTSQKTEKVSQVQYRDKVICVPVVLKRQESTIQTKGKMSNVIRTSCFDRDVDVVVVVQHQTPMNQKVQRKIKVLTSWSPSQSPPPTVSYACEHPVIIVQVCQSFFDTTLRGNCARPSGEHFGDACRFQPVSHKTSCCPQTSTTCANHNCVVTMAMDLITCDLGRGDNSRSPRSVTTIGERPC